MTATVEPRRAADIDARAATILVVCCAIWGLGLVMVKLANAGISPLCNSGLRSVFGGLILFGWTRLRGIPLFTADRTLWAGISCGVLFALEFLTLYAGLTMTQVARATIFLHCAPFVAAVGEHYFVPGHRLTRIKAGGLLAAFAGMIVALGLGGQALTRETILGDLLCLAGGIFWGMTTVVVRGTQLRFAAAEKTMLYQLATSAVVLLAASWAFGEAGITKLTPAVIGGFAYTVIFTVVLGYTTWFWLMRTYSAASLHAFTFLTPIFGVLFGHLLLGEAVGPAILAGLALVTVGIWLVNRPETNRPEMQS
jgi:drug/metabolite transporter (DMT)-like permease